MIFRFKLRLFEWTGCYWSPQGACTLESRTDSGYKKSSGVFLQPLHHQDEASGAHQDHSRDRTGQDRHTCAAQEETRAWEERSKRVWKEKKRNCFLKVFIYKLSLGQTQSYFLFLEPRWDPSLSLLRRAKGEDTGDEEQSKRAGKSPVGVTPITLLSSLGS